MIEDVWDEDSAYMEMLAREVMTYRCFPCCRRLMYQSIQGARLREKSETAANAEVEEEESDEDEDDIDEELGYMSPLDNVNPYVSFKQALTSKSQRNILPNFCMSNTCSFPSLPNAKPFKLSGGYDSS